MLSWSTEAVGILYLCQLLGFPLREQWPVPLQLQLLAFLASHGQLSGRSAAHQSGSWNGKLRSVVKTVGRRKPHTSIQQLTEGHLRLPQALA